MPLSPVQKVAFQKMTLAWMKLNHEISELVFTINRLSEIAQHWEKESKKFQLENELQNKNEVRAKRVPNRTRQKTPSKSGKSCWKTLY